MQWELSETWQTRKKLEIKDGLNHDTLDVWRAVGEGGQRGQLAAGVKVKTA